MRILHVNTRDDAGGAAKVARKLLEAYRERGHRSWMAVSVKHLSDPDIVAFENAPAAGPWARPWWRLHDRLPLHRERARRVASAVAAPTKVLREQLGIEDFEFPGTRRLLDLIPDLPDIVHVHNLHGRYFDLRELQALSRRVPVVVTLHDPWMFTGHCAYFLDCDRWRHGCGSCPHLDTSPAMRRDSTDSNWRRKRSIYRGSALFVAAPSRWLLERAEVSILSEGIVDTRLIPNGVDLSIFRPADKAAARQRVGLPQDERILLFSGFSPGSSSFKDLATIRAAAELLGTRRGPGRVSLLVLGETRETQRIGSVSIRSMGVETDESRVAAFNQAADIYVHAARVGAENHSLSVLEALACGVPVVATDVGGLSEQVNSLVHSDAGSPHRTDLQRPTGILTPPHDPTRLADAITRLLEDDLLSRSLSSNAAEDARRRFDLKSQVDSYLDWYRDILDERGGKRVETGTEGRT